MILVCPLCNTRYLVQANLFAAGARTVRCAKCKHSWKAELPKEIDAVGVPPDQFPETGAPIPEGSNLPVPIDDYPPLMSNKTALTIAASIFVPMLLWLIFDRQNLAHRLPFLEPIYDAVGLYIYYPGDELEFDQVRSELKYDAGLTELVLTGKIKNKTDKKQKIPNITAAAIGSDGGTIQSWQIDAPTATLAPGEDVAFTSSIKAPKKTVVNVILNFAEIKDDKS